MSQFIVTTHNTDNPGLIGAVVQRPKFPAKWPHNGMAQDSSVPWNRNKSKGDSRKKKK